MNQLGLDLPDEAREEPPPTVGNRRPPVDEALKRDILAALQIEELPPHLVDGEGRPRFPTKWPEHRDPMFIDAVVTGRPGGGFTPGPRDVHAINRAVSALVAEERVIQDRLYLGTTGPGGGDYQGWIPVFRVAEVT